MVRKLWRKNSQFALTLLAVFVGLVAGLGAVLFRKMISIVHNVAFFGTFSFHYNANAHTGASPWGPWIILVPVGGAVLVAFLVKNFAPEAKGHGVPEVIDVIYYARGVVRPAVAAVKSVASAISIGTGGSIGREGPIIQIGASFGSTVGQLINMPEWQRTTLIACGAGGGIAATFNTPLGGLLFAIELILPETSARTLIPVALGTGAASFVGRELLGNQPSFHIPALVHNTANLVQPSHLIIYVIFGLVLGLIGTLFIRMLYRFEDWFDAMPGNYYTRHCGGMLLVGVLMYLFMYFTGHYYVQGVGYATVEDALQNTLFNPYLIVLLLAAKLLVTSLTLGSGASGGIFSPALFLGAVSGAGAALVVNALVPGMHVNAVNLAVVGMASMVGSITGAVMTAIVMTFEMTRDYFVVIPLMVTVAIAYGIRRVLLTDTIYTFKLTRRGHYVPDSLQTNLHMLHSANDVGVAPLLRVAGDETMRSLRKHIADCSGRVPHVLVEKGGDVVAATSAHHVGELLRTEQWRDDDRIDRHVNGKFLVVAREELIFDVVSELRERHLDIALVMEDSGKSTVRSEAVVNVLTLGDIARSSNLLRHIQRTAPVRGAH